MFETLSGDGEPVETSEFSIEDDFNARMDALYDFADSHNIWVETR